MTAYAADDHVDGEDDVVVDRPYASAAAAYFAAGWAPLPIPGKWPPPTGWTGGDGAWPSRADVEAWRMDKGDLNIGLRLPAHILGIDVDNYGDKPGKATLEACEARWGPLPPTYVSTSRQDGTSGIRFFRVPEGMAWPSELPGGGVEIIRTAHRYAMVWPSLHPEGRVYQWVQSHPGSRERPAGFIPGPDDLPDLPQAWVDGLTGGRAAVEQARADLSDSAAVAWIAEHGQGVQCPTMTAVVRRASFDMVSGGSRHDAALRGTARICHLIQEGHTGGTDALGTMARGFDVSIKGDPKRAGEFARTVAGAVRLAVAVGPVVSEDPCQLPPEHRDLFGGGVTYAKPVTALGLVAELPRASVAGDRPQDGSGAEPVTGAVAGQPAPPADIWALSEAARAQNVAAADIAHGLAVAAEAATLRVRRDARKLVDTEEDLARHPLNDLDAQYLQAADLGQLPTPEPLIAGVLDRHTNALLSGRDGTYKTFLALDWALCLASGKVWQGRKVERMRVLYIAGEGAYGLAARVKAWEYAWGTTIEPGWFTVRRSAVNLYVGGAPLEDLIRRTRDEGYGLVVIDTLRRASGGADGNSSEMGVVIDNIVRIKDATADGSTLTITHTDKGDNDTRGFSGIEDDSDIVWHATRTDREVEIEMVKHKDGPDGEKIVLTPKIVLDSLILSGGSTTDDPGPTDGEFLTHMREMFAVTGATPAQFIEATGMPRSTVYKVRGRLERAGLIENRPKGSGFAMHLTTKGR